MPRSAPPNTPGAPSVVLGLRANLPQFALLVVINMLVGGMVGVQRTIVPLIGEREFGLASVALVGSFIAGFGLTKAAANLFAGPLADRFGRRRVLIAGWVVGLPVPVLIMWAPYWEWVVAANILLGVNQGLAWSMTVNMKIDLVGPRRRGLALGLNEFAGYVAVGATAWATGVIAARAGLRPEPLYLGVAYGVAGLLLSVALVRDTGAHVAAESAAAGVGVGAPPMPRGRVFALATWGDRTLFGAAQAGFASNLNDGVVWAMLPLLLAQRGLGLAQIGLVAGLYPLVWGLGQLATGALSDRIGRKPLVVGGMIVQGAALLVLGGAPEGAATGGPADPASELARALTGAALLGLGTAMAYPTLLAAVGDVAAPAWRARALAVYRFWRDLGFVVGVVACGIVADAAGLAWAVHAAGAATLLSGAVAWAVLRETRPRST
ncbi:MAG: MFS transporter [Phycisphaerales bacterium]